MRAAVTFLLTLLVLFAAGPARAGGAPIPTGKGLPVVVRAGVSFLEVRSINDTGSSFDATVDLRLVWEDPRLAFALSEAPSGFKAFRGEEADAKLAEIWSPKIVLSNLLDASSSEARALRLFPDGRVELMQRTKAQFKIDFDVERFPFDHQRLAVAVLSQRDPMLQVDIDFRQSEVDFSGVSKDVHIEGWRVGAVDLQRRPQAGWYGEQHAQIVASLQVVREPDASVLAIFIPICASLLIPLLAIWLNKTDEDGEFKIEAFELTNVVVGGLFAVIALNFTINTTYPHLARNNPVVQLFGLNYLLLATTIVLSMLLYRYGVVKRWFNRHVQREVFAYTVWAMPAAVIVAVALILVRTLI